MPRVASILVFCISATLIAVLPADSAPAKKTRPTIHKSPVAKPTPKITGARYVQSTAPVKPTAVSLARPTAVLAPAKASPAGILGGGGESAMVEIVGGGKGRINYEANVVKAVGLGALPPPTLSRSRAQDALDARHAALLDALRTLGMAVSRVRVSSDSRVQNYILQSDEIRLRVRALVQSAQVVEEKYLSGAGVFRVVVQTNLTGPNSLSEAVGVGKKRSDENANGIGAGDTLVSNRESSPPASTPASTPASNPYTPGAPAPSRTEYTSVIVDCRGLQVRACMSPRLFRKNGDEVYGTMHISPDYVIETGIAAFPRSMRDALRTSRTGERPLIVRATRVQDENRFYPVISDRDAEKVCEANRNSHFFERTAVVFLLDPAQ